MKADPKGSLEYFSAVNGVVNGVNGGTNGVAKKRLRTD